MSSNSKLDEIQFYLNILESSGKNIVNRYVENIRTRLNKNNLSGKFEIITNEEFYNSIGGGKSDDVTFPYAYFKRAFDMTIPNTKNDINTDKSNLEHDINTVNHELDDEDIDESEDDEDTDGSEDDDEDIDESDDDDSSDTGSDESDDDDSSDTSSGESDDGSDTSSGEDEESENIGESKKSTLVDSILKYEPLIIDNVNNTSTSMDNDVPVDLTPISDTVNGNVKHTLDIPTNYTGVISILVTIPYPKEDKQYVIEGGITQLNQFINKYEKGQ